MFLKRTNCVFIRSVKVLTVRHIVRRCFLWKGSCLSWKPQGSFPGSWEWGVVIRRSCRQIMTIRAGPWECDDAQGRSNNAQRTEVIIFSFWGWTEEQLSSLLTDVTDRGLGERLPSPSTLLPPGPAIHLPLLLDTHSHAHACRLALQSNKLSLSLYSDFSLFWQIFNN